MSRPESRRRLGRLFHAALARPAAEREDFLDRACGSNAALRAEVESLLAADAQAPTWMDEPVFAGACELLAREPGTERLGRQIGPYRIEREIGRGGMGAVYLAERDDGQFHQQVAVKWIRAGRDNDSIVRRFLDERQILADLAHPHIARLLDGGVTEEGEPYLVMEHVDGTPIDVYCDRCGLQLRHRLELFLKVCGAVQYAHRHLIVHCDLKPGNILVTREGEPKLLDFGIARLLAADRPRETGGPARGARPLTPEYASPEQVLGRAIATTSDIYSLGVLLYLLLTGTTPFRRPGASEPGAPRPRREIPLPSRVVRKGGGELPVMAAAGSREPSRVRLGRRLRGDLDSIVFEALRREPSRRYPSVEQLAEDLRCYLTGRPVTARRQTLAYRGGKFVRRHGLAVLSAALVTSSLVVGIGLATSQARRAERERGKAEQVTEFVRSLFREVDPARARGPDLTLGELLDDAVGPIRSGLAGESEVQADLLQILGDGYRTLGRFESARDLLEQALEIRLLALGDEHPAVARSLDGLGLLFLRQGDLGQAEDHVRRALDRRERLGERHADVADSLNSLGLVLMARGDHSAAEPLFRRALALRREIFGLPSREVSVSLNNLGTLLLASRRPEEALDLFEDVLEQRRRIFGERHLLVANGLHNLAVALTDLGERDAAEKREREALAIYREILGDDHASTAASLYNLARLLHAGGQTTEAREALEEAARINERNPVTFAAHWMLLGWFAYDEGDRPAAEAAFARALDLRRRNLGTAHPDFARALHSLVRVQRERGAAEHAAAELRSAVSAWRETPPNRAWDASYAEGLLGLVLLESGQASEAEARLRAGVRGLEELSRPDLASALEREWADLESRSDEPSVTSDRE